MNHEKIALPVEDQWRADIAELSANDVEQVSGGIVWAAIPLGWKVAGAIVGTGVLGFGGGAAAGYFANR